MLRTRIVRFLRVVLPLAALALLSVLFLLPGNRNPDPSIPFAEGGPEELGRAPGIGAPEYTTVTPDGALVTLRALRASPDGDGGTARGLTLDWRSRDGLLMVVTAPQGELQKSLLRLEGGVRMALSSGWEVTGPLFEADMAADTMRADQSVEVIAPFGELQAGALLIHPGEAGQVLELNQGVRLLYRP